MVLTIAAAVFVFGLLVLVHELGHFITAKMTGMRVDEFAIGFGPKIFSFTRGETVYSLRAIPLGGFNDIAGMDPANNEAGARGYCEKPVLSRMIVILAGSAMNFVLPVVLFFGIFFFSGVSTPNPEPVLGTVIAGKAADLAGLKDGDRVVMIEDVTTSGKSIDETYPILSAQADLDIKGLVVSLDRMEKGKGEGSALAEVGEKYSLQTTAIVTMADVTEYLYNRETANGVIIDDDIKKRIDEYYAQYGAK